MSLLYTKPTSQAQRPNTQPPTICPPTQRIAIIPRIILTYLPLDFTWKPSEAPTHLVLHTNPHLVARRAAPGLVGVLDARLAVAALAVVSTSAAARIVGAGRLGVGRYVGGGGGFGY